MKKIFIFSLILGFGLLTLSACTNSRPETEPERPIFNVSDEAAVVEPIKLDSGNYLILTEESQVAWHGQRILGSNHYGLVNLKSGNLIVENDTLTGGEFVIDMTSISSDESNDTLVKHLKSVDFFDVDKYGKAKLVVTGSEPSSESAFLVKGDLTIKDITLAIEFIATLKQEDGVIVAMSDFTIDRTLWDIRYGSGNFYKNLGDAAIVNEIGFKVYLQAIKQ